MKSTHIGTVDIDVGVHEKLQNVLYVPELQHNLLSVRALTKDGGKDVIFKKDGTVETVDDDNNSYKIGQAIGDLYQLTDQNALSARSTNDEYSLWHHRFGHAGRNVIMSLSKFVNGLENVKFTPLERVCGGCARAKSHRQPFGVATNQSKEILGRIHSDLCGPMPTPSVRGTKYILTFIDDATRFVTVYAILNKSDTFEHFIKFRTFTEKQTGKSIKILHSDGGGEYVNTDMRKYLSIYGIHHKTTTAETPEQNGVAERYNRTLFESIQAMMHAAESIPEPLWAELAATAAYLRNRLPTRANLEMRSPFELWYGQKPSVDHLCIIWSDAYMHISKSKRTKLTQRAKKLKLIGYHDEKKAYRLWDPVAQNIVISRDVIFDESAVLESPPTVILPVLITNQEEFLIDAIIDERVVNGENQYLVKWHGYSDDDDTWELLSHVAKTEALILWENNRKKQALYMDVITDDPVTYKDALSSQEAEHWQEAIESELKSLGDNNTWTIIPRIPPGRRPIGCKWIFKRKLNPDGTIARYKARLVAKGYSQQHGVDYDETYTPAAKFMSIRTILTIGVILNLEIHQMDVKTAFLHGDLFEEIYMSISEGVDRGLTPRLISKEDQAASSKVDQAGSTINRDQAESTIIGDQAESPKLIKRNQHGWTDLRDGEGVHTRIDQAVSIEDQVVYSEDQEASSSKAVCRLNQTLYGLKQSPQMWNKKIDEYLISKQGFKRLNSDYSIYIRHNSKNSGNSENAKSVLVIIALSVDNLLLLM